MTGQFRFKLALLASAAVFAGHAWAQDAASTDNADEDDRTLDTVVVVGSQIKGSSITGALPVTVQPHARCMACHLAGLTPSHRRTHEAIWTSNS